jgi:type VI secretion system protein ImpF
MRTQPAAEAPRPRPSLLDRLIDDAPDRLRDPQPSAGEALMALRQSVRRDLEALLNAHRRWRSWPASYSELDISPLAWGIPDFTAGAFTDPDQRERLCAEVEEAIRRFEPRLARVRVSLRDPKDALAPTLHLRIDGLLRIEPAPEPVAFDTLIDPATAAVRVLANADRRSPPEDV